MPCTISQSRRILFTLQSPRRFFKFNIVTLPVSIYPQYLLLVVKFDQKDSISCMSCIVRCIIIINLIPFHDSAVARHGATVAAFLENKRIKVSHQPLRSPDLASRNYSPSPRLQVTTKGKRYDSI